MRNSCFADEGPADDRTVDALPMGCGSIGLDPENRLNCSRRGARPRNSQFPLLLCPRLKSGAGEEAMRNVMIIAVVARIVVDQIVDRAMVAAAVVAHALNRQPRYQHLGQPLPSLSVSSKRWLPSTRTWTEPGFSCSGTDFGFCGGISGGC